MEKSLKRQLIAAGLAAVILTALGYWVDDDPPYADVWHTISEACFLIILLFVLIFLLFRAFSAVISQMKARR